MSLNGLESPAVIEAYQVALNEAGGWFLLHYVSRDEVALFERGTGGVPEVRNSVDGYEEVSPLYGFLQYRRRKVVLSYLPEGLSRLVQARTTVQFQSILDKFSPHDTVFTLSQSSQLTESALSSACLLHTASGSITSSSSSLRRRRLMEIAEDAEENNTLTRDAEPVQPPGGSVRQRSYSQLSEATIVAAPTPSDTQPPVPNDTPAPSDAAAATVPENAPDPAHAQDAQPPMPVEPNVERAPSVRSFREDLSQPLSPSESRRSTQSARPSLRELERTGTYPQKVKRGPRPSVDVNGRPRTAGNLSRSIEQQRPVAAMPAGVRSSSLRRTSPPTARPRSQGSSSVAVAATPSKQAPPIPPLLVPPLSTPISRPQMSPGAKSLSALSSSGTSQEKERLMKALQLRKTQLQKQARGGGNKKVEKAVHDESQQQQQQQQDPTMSPSENKENMEDGSNDKKEESPATVDSSRSLTPMADPRPAPIATEPMEQSPEADAASLSPPKPGSATVEIKEVAPPEAGENSFNMPAANVADAPTQPSTDCSETSAKEAAPEAQTLSQAETDAGEADSALPDAKSGPGSPSAVIDVPLQAESLKAPEEITIMPSPPTENPVISGALDDDATGGKTASPIRPQSIPLPTSPSPSPSPPPASSRPTSIPDSPPTVIASEAPEPQHELAAAPELSIAQQTDAAHWKDKRKPCLEPIQVPTPEYSDDDNFSDDSFMEELKSATVEEAKPISVGKSPLSPGYSNNGNERTSPDAWRNSRAVSNPSAIGGQSPSPQALAVGRSVSTPYPEMDSASNPVLVAKKINVSSGISKRIKALEKFSSNRDAPSHSAPSLAAPSASSSFETLRKRASVSLGHSDPPSRHGSYSPETFSRASSLRRRDSGAGALRAANSVSVTARIVRDSGASPGETNGNPPESGVLNLQPSQLTVEHEPADASPAAPTLAPEPANKSDKRSMSTSSAGSGPRSVSPTMQRSESRLSISSASRNDRADVPSSPEDKRESRTSRLLRRMSSITSNSRKNTAGVLSPVVNEEASAPEAIEAPQAVDIGEANVQFPDTLLWKRRFIRIDDKGFLVLTPGNVDSSSRNMVKRYHLSEFRTPCLPDEDRQELPNSILLDFLDGRTLQCACESRQGQAFVLQTLVGAHASYQSPAA